MDGCPEAGPKTDRAPLFFTLTSQLLCTTTTAGPYTELVREGALQFRPPAQAVISYRSEKSKGEPNANTIHRQARFTLFCVY